jgi:hypothetical protein
VSAPLKGQTTVWDFVDEDPGPDEDALEERRLDVLRAKHPQRIGICPVHGEEFWYPLAPGENATCPVCPARMSVYVLETR